MLILPGLGIIAEVVANNARKPLWGYNQMVYGLLVLGFLSMIVWAHHMYLTGMGTAVSSFFQLTTIIISVPTILILSSLIISLWGGSIRFTVADALGHRVPAALRHRRLDRHSARLQRARHLPARFLLHHRPLPLRHRAGHDLRPLRRRPSTGTPRRPAG